MKTIAAALSKTLVLSLALASIGLVPALAQSGSFGDTTSVVVVEVPVQVISDGAPVRGLTRDDFELLDGRKAQEIIGFDVVDLTMIDARQASSSQILPPAARRHFLMLFDLSFSAPSAVVKARQAARDLVLEGLHPSDLVAVGTYSRAGAKLVLGFTSDRRQIELALDTLGMAQLVDRVQDPLGVVLSDLTSFDPLSESGASGGGGGGGPAGAAGVNFEAEIFELLQSMEASTSQANDRNSILALTGSLTELAGWMAGVDGRKHVVFLSEGFNSSILLGNAGSNEEEFRRMQEQNQAAMTGDFSSVNSDERFGSTATLNVVEDMLTEFVRADCAVQTVDIGGLRAGGERPNNTQGKDGLFMLADRTGGEFYQNFNNLDDAMGKMLETTSVTYVLAFQPRKLKADGKFHKIRVKLKGGPKKARLVHRPGYYAPKPYGQIDPMTRQLSTADLVLAGEPGGAVATSVLAASFQNPAGGRAYVPVLVEIDGQSLITGQRSNVVPTEIYAYAVAADGSVRDFFTQAFGLDLAQAGAALRQSGFKFYGQLDLPPGDYAVRVLVRNGESGAHGLSIADVKVPAMAQNEAALMPPLIPEPQGKWLLGRDQRTQDTSVPYPFTLNGQAFIPAAKPVLAAGQQTEMALVAYNLGQGEPAVTGQLFDAAGTPVSGARVSLVERPATGVAGLDRLVARLATEQLTAGEYRLAITVTDPASSNQLTSEIPVIVR